MSTRRLIKDNPKEVLKLLLYRLNCKYRNDYFLEMKKHPDFPSFLSYHHILKKLGIDSIAIETNFDELHKSLPKPVLIHISSNEGMFLLLEKIDDEFVYIINETNQLEKQAIDEFKKIWNGYVLIVDSENIIEQKSSLTDRINSSLEYVKNPLCIVFLSVILIYFLFFNGDRSIFNIFFILEFAAGIIISSLLLVEYFDNKNTFIKQLCASKNDKDVNCSSILNSKDANLFGVISWSDIGLLYFVISFSISLFFPRDVSIPYSVLSSIAISPYVIYSIYYQKFIARTWCTLCLFTQAVILALFLTSSSFLINFDLEYTLSIKSILEVILSAIAIIVAYAIIKPLIKNNYILQSLSSQFNVLKHKTSVKHVLFNEQASVSFENLERIIIGNTKGANCITIIFSPICEPCMVELRKLLPILNYKDNTRIELLFLVDSSNSTVASQLANSMLEIYFENQESFKAMLNSYVLNYPKSKFQFEKLYGKKIVKPTTKALLVKHEKWCIANHIYATPQILINHKYTPSVYSEDDFDYLLD